MKLGEATQIHGFGGDFFAFDLSKKQAEAKGLKETTIIHLEGKHQGQRAEDMVARLGVPQIDNDDNLDGSAKITGKISVKTLATSSEKLAWHLAFRIGKTGTSSTIPLKSLPEDKGVVRFSFPPINSKSDEPYSGPLVVFIDLCTTKNIDGNFEITVLSNTVGVLVDVAPSEGGKN